MKFISSLFFLLIMSASIAMSVVEQVYGEEICKLECSTDDDTEEKKSDKEKEIYLFEYHPIPEGSHTQEQALRSLFAHSQLFLSDFYSPTLEIPPDAAPCC